MKEEKGLSIWERQETPALEKDPSWLPRELARLRSLFLEGKVQRIQLLYPGYNNALSQGPKLETLLPLPRPAPASKGFPPLLEGEEGLFLEGPFKFK